MGIGDDELDAAQTLPGEAAQKVGSEGLCLRRADRPFDQLRTGMPSTSRRPSPFTPTATVTATETMRPAWRTFRYVASTQTYGQSPSMG